MKVIYLVGREMILLCENTTIPQFGGFGVCLFTHLFLAKLRPKQTQTNHNCQRYCTFVFVIMQERILQKLAKIRPKRTKMRTSLENVSKAKAGKAKLPLLSSDCQNTTCGIRKWQKQFLEQKFAKLAGMVPQVCKLTEMAPEHVIWKKSQLRTFRNQKLSQLVLGGIIWRVCKFSPSILQICKISPRIILFWELNNKVRCGISSWKKWSLKQVWNIGSFDPSIFSKVQNWSLG